MSTASNLMRMSTISDLTQISPTDSSMTTSAVNTIMNGGANNGGTIYSGGVRSGGMGYTFSPSVNLTVNVSGESDDMTLTDKIKQAVIDALNEISSRQERLAYA